MDLLNRRPKLDLLLQEIATKTREQKLAWRPASMDLYYVCKVDRFELRAGIGGRLLMFCDKAIIFDVGIPGELYDEIRWQARNGIEAVGSALDALRAL